MKLFAALLALFSASAVVSAKPAAPSARVPQPGDPLDLDRMLSAIEQAENTKYWQVGRAGERSVYQITRSVWEKWSAMPFEHASSNRVVCRAEVRRVALAHLEFIRDELAKWDLPDRPWNIAACWGGGVSALVSGKLSAQKRAYATRCHNLFYAQ